MCSSTNLFLLLHAISSGTMDSGETQNENHMPHDGEAEEWEKQITEICWSRSSQRVATWQNNTRPPRIMEAVQKAEIPLAAQAGQCSRCNFPSSHFLWLHCGAHLTPHPWPPELETTDSSVVTHLRWTNLVPHVARARRRWKKRIIWT